jgi:hydrogenase maturation protein HypF
VAEALIKEVMAEVPTSKNPARLHNGLAEAVRVFVRKTSADLGIREVALSGGVWQNIILLRRALSLLQSNGFEVYIDRGVPPNDGGLSLGQAMIAASRLRG